MLASRAWAGGGLALALALASCGDSALFSSTPPATGTAGGAAQGAGGGQGGSAGTPGAGGVGGVVSGGGGVGAEGAGGGSGVGAPCTWGGEPCPAGLYCLAPGCGAGTCQHPLPVGQQLGHLEPVCGCDDVTYWNGSVAESHGMSILHPDRCAVVVPCHPDDNPCPDGLRCSRRVDHAGACWFGPLGGACVGVPEVCEPGPPRAHSCDDLVGCAPLCELITSERPWYEDPFCSD